MLEGRPRQIVQAVDGVDFAIAKRRDLRRWSANTAAASRRSRAASSASIRRPRARSVFDGNDMATAPQRSRQSALRRRHADDLPGPLRQPQSALAGARHHRRADPRLRPAPRTRPICASGSASCCARSRLTPADGEKFPHEFSGGQRQRISIARALASRAGIPGLRRADLGARRLGAGADPEPDDGSAAPARPDLSVHQPQSRGGLSHLGPRRA